MSEGYLPSDLHLSRPASMNTVSTSRESQTGASSISLWSTSALPKPKARRHRGSLNVYKVRFTKERAATPVTFRHRTQTESKRTKVKKRNGKSRTIDCHGDEVEKSQPLNFVYYRLPQIDTSQPQPEGIGNDSSRPTTSSIQERLFGPSTSDDWLPFGGGPLPPLIPQSRPSHFLSASKPGVTHREVETLPGAPFPISSSLLHDMHKVETEICQHRLVTVADIHRRVSRMMERLAERMAEIERK